MYFLNILQAPILFWANVASFVGNSTVEVDRGRRAARGSSDGERVGFRQLAGFPRSRELERLQRSSLVTVDHHVELIGEPSDSVITFSPGLRLVDDSDGALQTRFAQSICSLATFAEC
jgi:hypothetical protein